MTNPNPDSALGRKIWTLRQCIEYEKSIIKGAIGDELWQEMGFTFITPTYYAVAISEKYGITLFTEKEKEGQCYYIMQKWWVDAIRRGSPDLLDKCKVTPDNEDRLRDVLATLAGRAVIFAENVTANEGTKMDDTASRESYEDNLGRFLASMLNRIAE